MNDATKRANYFDRQFLRLSNFQNEQLYHLDRRWRHNRLMHTYGVAEGLVVTKDANQDAVVIVSAGTGYDVQGREIVLAVANNDPGRAVDLSGVELDQGQYATPLYLSVSYDEQLTDASTDPGTNGFHSIGEEPLLTASRVKPVDDGKVLLLAAIDRDPGTGKINSVDSNPAGRHKAGVRLSGLVTGAELADDAVENRHIKNGAVTADKILDGSVGNAELAQNAVTTDKIANSAVTNGQLQNGSVSQDKLQNSCVGTNNVQNGAITTAKLAFIQFGGSASVAGNATVMQLVESQQDPASKSAIYLPATLLLQADFGAVEIDTDIIYKASGTTFEAHIKFTNKGPGTALVQWYVLKLVL